MSYHLFPWGQEGRSELNFSACFQVRERALTIYCLQKHEGPSLREGRIMRENKILQLMLAEKMQPSVMSTMSTYSPTKTFGTARMRETLCFRLIFCKPETAPFRKGFANLLNNFWVPWHHALNTISQQPTARTSFCGQVSENHF